MLLLQIVFFLLLATFACLVYMLCSVLAKADAKAASTATTTTTTYYQNQVLLPDGFAWLALCMFNADTSLIVTQWVRDDLYVCPYVRLFSIRVCVYVCVLFGRSVYLSLIVCVCTMLFA